ncbi:MAG: protein-L-isoaspartate(D-aspartate) O-methyltransferase [Planctomycetes bacterium]|nr:protein-L-isoaspartate(D-aspartate) O-methyltransferase [Planctomycetota bacterium]
MTEFDDQRARMVEHQLAGRGIRDPRVLDAMGRVPRERFVEPSLVASAYADGPLPIGEGQTISQPFVVALMIESLGLDDDARVLEVGTGSGYAAAVLSLVAGVVYTIERQAGLAGAARRRLAALGYDRVHVRHGDGTLGWPEHAPYDGIVVAAGGREVPRRLRDQLAIGARLVIPLGRTRRAQNLDRLTRTGPESYEHDDLGEVRFVPLVGRAGWSEDRPGGIPGMSMWGQWRRPVADTDDPG